MSNNNHLQVRLALKAAQACLAKGLNCLRVATSACGNGAPLEKGELFVPVRGDSPNLSGEGTFCTPLSQFLPAGLGLLGTDGDREGFRECTILASEGSVGGAFQFLQGYKSRITTPLSGKLGRLRGQSGLAYNNVYMNLHTARWFDKDWSQDKGSKAYNLSRAYPSNTLGERGASNPRVKQVAGQFEAPQGPAAFSLNSPHGPETRICSGVIAQGAQGQFPNCFSLKTRCSFSSHASKSNLATMVTGAYYMMANDAHGFSELRLLLKAAALAPAGLLKGSNNLGGWKAIIHQLEDQRTAGMMEPEEAAAQAAGLVEFAEWVLKTPYTTMLMQSVLWHTWVDSKGNEGKGLIGAQAGGVDPLQCLEGSISHLHGRIGVWVTDARYLTLRGGVGML
jgi:hypothetical protein